MNPSDLWSFLLPGYLLTVALEFPVLWWGLHRGHPRRTRVVAAFWLTACTYPIVVLVLPLVPWSDGSTLGESRAAYLAIAETFAPAAECLLFWLATNRAQPRAVILRDTLAITLANLLSFTLGHLLLEALPRTAA